MKTSETKNMPLLLGPDKLTAEQVGDIMPDKKRWAYLRSMTAQDMGHYFASRMVKNLNAQQKD